MCTLLVFLLYWLQTLPLSLAFKSLTLILSVFPSHNTLASVIYREMFESSAGFYAVCLHYLSQNAIALFYGRLLPIEMGFHCSLSLSSRFVYTMKMNFGNCVSVLVRLLRKVSQNMVSEMRCVYVYERAQNTNANCFGVKNESSSSSSSSSIRSAALDAYTCACVCVFCMYACVCVCV